MNSLKIKHTDDFYIKVRSIECIEQLVCIINNNLILQTLLRVNLNSSPTAEQRTRYGSWSWSGRHPTVQRSW